MSDACHFLHHALTHLPRFRREELSRVPKNGIYVLFEKGEVGHDVERIVRIGTHTGQGNLAVRIREHLYTPNKDRSIFRKHIGRCLLAADPFLAQWQLDLTTRAARTAWADTLDKDRLKDVENEVTQYMANSFSFCVLQFEAQADRLHYEQRLLSTVFDCRDCGPSEGWLGRSHPSSELMRRSGLWNVQGLRGAVLSVEEATRIIELGANRPSLAG